jgi:hypothetical protein
MRLLALSLLLCAASSACIAPRRPVPHASPEEAAAVAFPPQGLPKEGRLRLEGNTAAAIQLALDDFLPWDAPPTTGPVPLAPCLRLRESYDVTVAPGPEGVTLVRFTVNAAACDTGETVTDATTYAIDIRTMRILSREVHTRPRPTGTPQPPAAGASTP